MLKKVQRVRAFEQAVEQLQEAILGGQFHPGDRLPTEQELCDSLDVSRSTIREALRVLEAGGLIEVRRGSGAYVAEKMDSLATRGEILKWLSKREESVIQILQVREGIEWLTASLTAKNNRVSVLNELKRIIDEQKTEAGIKSRVPDVKKLAELDVLFHTTISAASGNEIAHEIIAHIVPSFSEANKAVLWAGRNIQTSIGEHELIVSAIEAGNPSAAEKAMRSHIERVREEICDYLGEGCSDEE